MGYTLHGTSMWVHPKAYDRDTSLMDDMLTARERLRGTVPAFKEHDLWGVLACRLYLKATMLSEIVDETGGHYIENWAMYGEHQNRNTDIKYPFQPKSPPSIWKTWRDCLHSTYVGSGRTRDRIPLYRPINMTNTAITTWQERIKDGQSLKEAIRMLPMYLREAVGDVHYPSDNGAKLVNEMLTADSVHSWSDGTVKDEKGAHAYTLRTQNDDERFSITGTAMTPADIVSLTSLRTEHYGALGVVVTFSKVR